MFLLEVYFISSFLFSIDLWCIFTVRIKWVKVTQISESGFGSWGDSWKWVRDDSLLWVFLTHLSESPGLAIVSLRTMTHVEYFLSPASCLPFLGHLDSIQWVNMPRLSQMIFESSSMTTFRGSSGLIVMSQNDSMQWVNMTQSNESTYKHVCYKYKQV